MGSSLFCKIYDEKFTKLEDIVTFRAGIDENSKDVKTRILINSKEQQLSGKDEEISNLNEEINKLKARVDQIFKEKKDLRKLLKDNNIAILESLETAELGIQTEPLENKATELEEQLLEKRLENIQDFTDYRNKLADKEQIITELQERIKNLLAQPDNNKKRALILGIIALINSILLIFK